MFLRFLSSIAVAALLNLLLLSFVLLAFQPPMGWLLLLSRAQKIALFFASFFLLFLLAFFSPALARLASLKRKKSAMTDFKPSASGAGEKEAESRPISPPAFEGNSRANAPVSADFVAQVVSRAVGQAVASISQEGQPAFSASDSRDFGRYVCRLSGGFEGVLPSGGGDSEGDEVDLIKSQSGVFIIDFEAASAQDEADIDSNFQRLVNSVLT